jgi:hypothetical protein
MEYHTSLVYGLRALGDQSLEGSSLQNGFQTRYATENLGLQQERRNLTIPERKAYMAVAKAYAGLVSILNF